MLSLANTHLVQNKYQAALLQTSGVHFIMTQIINGVPTIVVISDKPAYLPSSLEGVPVKNVVGPRYYLKGAVPRQICTWPANAGLGISNTLNHDSVGTNGLVFTKYDANNVPSKYILSCCHVLARNNTTGVLFPLGSDIFQTYDPKATPIAKLDFSIPWKTTQDNTVDLAWARVIDTTKVGVHTWELQPDTTKNVQLLENFWKLPAIGDIVTKSGYKTGVTHGKVISLNGGGYVTESYLFKDMIVVSEPFSSPGDSGSAVITDDGHFVGLLNAGSDPGTDVGTTTIIKASNILNYLGKGNYFYVHTSQQVAEPWQTGMPIGPIEQHGWDLYATIPWINNTYYTGDFWLTLKVTFPDGTFVYALPWDSSGNNIRFVFTLPNQAGMYKMTATVMNAYKNLALGEWGFRVN